MTIKEARGILRIHGNITKEELHKAYREEIRRYHPDMGGSTKDAILVNIAYDTLKRNLGNLEPTVEAVKKEAPMLITLSDLISLYNNKTVKVRLNYGNVLEVNKSVLREKEVFIEFEVNLVKNGVASEKITRCLKWASNDNYEIVVHDGISIGDKIEVSILNKNVNVNIVGHASIKFSFMPEDVNVRVILEGR